MTERSILLDRLMPDSSDNQDFASRLLTVAQTSTENALELIKRQQEQIQKQLSHQQYLYQNLLNYGLLQQNNGQYDVSGSGQSGNRQRFFFDSERKPSNTMLGGLSSAMLPFSNMFSGFGSILERLLGTKLWSYAIVVILIGVVLTMVACFCMYCCCCTPLGRICRCQCPRWCFLNKTKKKESNKSNTTANTKCSFISNIEKPRKCCV